MYSHGLTLDQLINTHVAPMYRQAEAGERSWFHNSPIACNDGTTLSVQASHAHYCSPRGDDAPYVEMEVGFPTADPGTDWLTHKDNPHSGDFKDVYAYVPVWKIRVFINQHGGEKLPA